MTRTTCPNCRGELAAQAVPFTPPWRCGHCLISWYNAELAADVVDAWRPRFRDFGNQAASVAAAVAAERGMEP